MHFVAGDETCPGLNGALTSITADFADLDGGWASADLIESQDDAVERLRASGIPEDLLRLVDVETPDMNVWGHALQKVLKEGSFGIPNTTGRDAVHVHVVTCPSLRWALRTYKIQSNCYAIVGTSALADAFYAVSKVAIATLDRDGGRFVSPEVGQRLLRLFLRGPRAATRWERPVDVVLDEPGLALASGLTTSAEEFAIRHELAHLSLDHFEGIPPYFLGIGTSVSGDGVVSDEWSAEQVREMDADLHAIGAHLLASDSASIDELSIRCAGIALALSVLGALDDSAFWVRPTTHPPTIGRLAAARRFTTLVLESIGMASDHLAGIMSFGGYLDDFLRSAMSAEYVPPYRSRLTEVIGENPRLQLFDEADRDAVDSIDEEERALRQTVFGQLSYLYRMGQFQTGEDTIARIISDFRESRTDVFELLLAEMSPNFPPDGRLGRSPEEWIARCVVAHVWFWEEIVFDLARRSGFADEVAVRLQPSIVDLIRDRVPTVACVGPVVGLLRKAAGGLYDFPALSPATEYAIKRDLGLATRTPFDVLLAGLEFEAPYTRMRRNVERGRWALDGLLDAALSPMIASLEKGAIGPP